MSKRYEQFTTEEFTAVYPSLDKPNTKFSQNCYEVSMRMDPNSPEFLDFKASLENYDPELFKEITGKEMPSELKFPIKPEKEKLTDGTYRETGNVLIRFKAPSTIVKRKTGETIPNIITIYDTAGNRMIGVNVWGGSKIKVAYQMTPYSTGFGAGISLKLRQVMVVELVTNQNEPAFEFGGEGYVTEERDTPVNRDDSIPVDPNYPPEEEVSHGEDIPF